jgi:hypothetical protein
MLIDHDLAIYDYQTFEADVTAASAAAKKSTRAPVYRGALSICGGSFGGGTSANSFLSGNSTADMTYDDFDEIVHQMHNLHLEDREDKDKSSAADSTFDLQPQSRANTTFAPDESLSFNMTSITTSTVEAEIKRPGKWTFVLPLTRNRTNSQSSSASIASSSGSRARPNLREIFRGRKEGRDPFDLASDRQSTASTSSTATEASATFREIRNQSRRAEMSLTMTSKSRLETLTFIFCLCASNVLVFCVGTCRRPSSRTL